MRFPGFTIVGLMSTQEEMLEYNNIAKIVITANRFKELARSTRNEK